MMVDLTTEEWRKAEAIARDLARDVDRNELGKMVSYFQRVKDKERFLKLLQRLPRTRNIRSMRTQRYLERIASVCQQHLADVPHDKRALTIVAWAFRLMTYEQTRTGRRYAQSR